MNTTRGGAETCRNFLRVSPPLGFCTAATTAGVARINALVGWRRIAMHVDNNMHVHVGLRLLRQSAP